MPKYTLDTNVLIDALNQPDHLEALLGFLAWALPATYVSAVVAHELAAGASTARQRALLEHQLLGPFERRGRIVAPSTAAWRRAGQIVQGRRRPNTASALNDLLLAVSAREMGLSVITRDADFSRLGRVVKGLAVAPPFPTQSGGSAARRLGG